MSVVGTPRRFAAVPNFGRDRSEAGWPKWQLIGPRRCGAWAEPVSAQCAWAEYVRSCRPTDYPIKSHRLPHKREELDRSLASRVPHWPNALRSCAARIGFRTALPPRPSCLMPGEAPVLPLYRSKRWLTLAQLMPAWATELADATTSANKCEGQLWDSLLDDMINGRFDGKVLGLAVIRSDKRATPVKGKVLGELDYPVGRNAHRILISKKAVLNFARRYGLSRPTWWGLKPKASKGNAADMRPATPAVGTAGKRRKGPQPGSVDRFGQSDEALFPEIDRITRESRKSVHAATLELALKGRIEGTGTDASRAKRLANRYRKARE